MSLLEETEAITVKGFDTDITRILKRKVILPMESLQILAAANQATCSEREPEDDMNQIKELDAGHQTLVEKISGMENSVADRLDDLAKADTFFLAKLSTLKLPIDKSNETKVNSSNAERPLAEDDDGNQLKTVQNLYELTNSLENLYGADILLISRLLSRVLKYETEQSGFNLSHKQERDFIKQIVNVASCILNEENLISLKKVWHLDSDTFVGLLDLFKAYGTTLAKNRLDTYTNPFEITAKNIMFGLDTVDSLVREGNPQSRVQTDIALASRQSQEDHFVVIPKYNHYMRDPAVWDNTKIHVPQSLLHIDEELGPDTRPTLSYVFYRTLPDFLPQLYQSDLVARWEVISEQSLP